ncbi:hypothetical protein LP414_28015 [Polaromonas sp. P1(28)-13]|nr:hypothetical protein LP414_28015 [Polaromonas sp. P1(28)-13]
MNLDMSKVMIERNLATDSLDVHVLVRADHKESHVLMPLSNLAIRMVPRGEHYEREPAFRLCRQSARALMDGLWEAGVRPSSGDQGNSGALNVVTTAMQAHIDDLRAVLHISTTADRPHGQAAFS